MYLNFHKTMGSTESCEKAAVFWVIYFLEKTLCFNDASTSVIMELISAFKCSISVANNVLQLLVDFDIGCLIPKISEAVFEGCDWFLSSVTLARMLSISYETLFAVKATSNPVEQQILCIRQVYAGLERWKMSIPKPCRPGESVELHGISPTLSRILLHQHLSYYSVLMAISRLAIHIGEPNGLSEDRIGKKSLIRAACQVLELTRFIELKDYCPLW